MPQQLLTLATLHEYEDGSLAAEFDELLRAAVLDCLAKPGIDKARKVALEVTLTPITDSSGVCEDLLVHVRTSAKSPARPFQAYRMRTTRRGGLKFSPSNPLDPDAEDPGQAE
jgi:hypothetical protein